jgi:hypothetical protein
VPQLTAIRLERPGPSDREPERSGWSYSPWLVHRRCTKRAPFNAEIDDYRGCAVTDQLENDILGAVARSPPKHRSRSLAAPAKKAVKKISRKK